MSKSRVIPACLFGSFFCVYVLSLPLFSERFVSPLIFGADDMLDAYQGGPGRNLMAKHPLFRVVSLLYWIGTHIFSWAPPILAHNLSMVFPMATLGAAAVCVAYFTFLHNHANREEAISFAVLYGISGTAWLFSSFPETYVLTALCSNLVLWSILGDPKATVPSHVNRTALLNALACLASPQQIFLTLISFVRWVREFGLSTALIRRVVRYGAVFSAAFLIPYQIYLKLTGMGWRFGPVYLQVYGHMRNLLSPRWAAVVLANFFVYSVVPPAVQPQSYTDRYFSIWHTLPLTWVLVAGLFLAFCVFSLRGLKSPAARDTAIPMLAFLAAYSLFFLYFNPSEAYLYTLPALLPWLLTLQGGFGTKWNISRRIVLWVVIGAIGLNNLHFRIFLHGIKLR
jgi:hypothetical protein